ncbi:MAG: diguanylate cyclase [Chloroflexi bacterium]|nr:diguanylate cyclase [Chloroflexota bacterium]
MLASVAVYAWRRRSTNGARQFTVFTLAITVYVLGYSMELSSLDLGTMLFWSKIQYLGILTFPTLYLIFAVQYAGGESWLTRRNLLLLFLLPAALAVIKQFDDSLHWIYAETWVETAGSIPMLAFDRGPVYMIYVAYNLLVVTLGHYILVRKWRSASQLYRKQVVIILSTAVFIYGVYIFYLIGAPLPPELRRLDLNAFVYSIWGASIGLAIFRYRLFDLAPIARDALIEMLNDGVVVLDEHARIVDANPEAKRLFAWEQPLVGEYAQDCLYGWVSGESLDAMEQFHKSETELTRNGVTTHYELSISALRAKSGKNIGYLVVAHDITQRKEIEKQLQDLSLVDELTGLNNRRGFYLLAGQWINMAPRMAMNAGLIYIDLDKLKWINDNLGHSAGDQALRETGAVLRNSFRASDLLARIGGDEFVVLAVESADNSTEAMLQRLDEQLKAHNARPGRNFSLSFSIGLARYNWSRPVSLDALMGAADSAMYAHKQAKKK